MVALVLALVLADVGVLLCNFTQGTMLDERRLSQLP